MGWTKRELLAEAFAEMGLPEYDFDLQPEETQRALRRMDSLVATWGARGIRIGYPLPTSPEDSDLDQESGIPDAAAEALYLTLAIRLAPGYGKQVSQDTKVAARQGYDALLWPAAQPQTQQFPSSLPRGAGNKPWRTTSQPFFPAPDENPLQISPGGDLNILPE